MNMLRYDAAALGNHEFNYGLDFLGRATKGAKFPVLSANITWADGRPYAPPFAILERELVARDGRRHRLKIGVIGFLPPQVTVWDKVRLQDRVRTQDIVESAQRHIPALRQKCDVLIALCHSGISASVPGGHVENAALQLAAVPGIDAVFHRPFASGVPRAGLCRDPRRRCGKRDSGRNSGGHARLLGKPSRRHRSQSAKAGQGMAGRRLRRRGPADLSPRRGVRGLPGGGRSGGPGCGETEHQAAIAFVGRPIGHLTAPVNSYFAVATDESSLALVNRAQLWYAKPLLVGTRHESLPLLSAASPMKAGGSPDAFTEIPAGEVALRNIADLYIYPNVVTAVRVNGTLVREWLERSAAFFNRLDPAREGPQPLLAGRRPAYNFDVIAGVTYEIDLTQPARYNGSGKLADGSAWRIRDLRLEGRPLDPDQEVIVVTNNYRAAGGGGFPGLDGSNIVLEGPDANRDAIVRYVEDKGNPGSPADGQLALRRAAAPPGRQFRKLPRGPRGAGRLSGHQRSGRRRRRHGPLRRDHRLTIG